MHHALLACHGLLLLSSTAAVLMQPLSLGVRLVVTVIVAMPLLLSLPGLLAKNRRTLQWLALVSVLYVGIGSVEVIASLGTAKLSAAAFLFALCELGLLVVMIRRPQTAVIRE